MGSEHSVEQKPKNDEKLPETIIRQKSLETSATCKNHSESIISMVSSIENQPTTIEISHQDDKNVCSEFINDGNSINDHKSVTNIENYQIFSSKSAEIKIENSSNDSQSPDKNNFVLEIPKAENFPSFENVTESLILQPETKIPKPENFPSLQNVADFPTLQTEIKIVKPENFPLFQNVTDSPILQTETEIPQEENSRKRTFSVTNDDDRQRQDIDNSTKKKKILKSKKTKISKSKNAEEFSPLEDKLLMKRLHKKKYFIIRRKVRKSLVKALHKQKYYIIKKCDDKSPDESLVKKMHRKKYYIVKGRIKKPLVNRPLRKKIYEKKLIIKKTKIILDGPNRIYPRIGSERNSCPRIQENYANDWLQQFQERVSDKSTQTDNLVQEPLQIQGNIVIVDEQNHFHSIDEKPNLNFEELDFISGKSDQVTEKTQQISESAEQSIQNQLSISPITNKIISLGGAEKSSVEIMLKSILSMLPVKTEADVIENKPITLTLVNPPKMKISTPKLQPSTAPVTSNPGPAVLNVLTKNSPLKLPTIIVQPSPLSVKVTVILPNQPSTINYAERPKLSTPMTSSVLMSNPSLMSSAIMELTPSTSVMPMDSVTTNPSHLVYDKVENPNPSDLVSDVAKRPNASTLVSNVAKQPNPLLLASDVAEMPNPSPLGSDVAKRPHPSTLVSDVAKRPNLTKLVSNDAKKPNPPILVLSIPEKPNPSPSILDVNKGPNPSTLISDVAKKPNPPILVFKIPKKPNPSTLVSDVTKRPNPSPSIPDVTKKPNLPNLDFNVAKKLNPSPSIPDVIKGPNSSSPLGPPVTPSIQQRSISTFPVPISSTGSSDLSITRISPRMSIKSFREQMKMKVSETSKLSVTPVVADPSPLSNAVTSTIPSSSASNTIQCKNKSLTISAVPQKKPLVTKSRVRQNTEKSAHANVTSVTASVTESTTSTVPVTKPSGNITSALTPVQQQNINNTMVKKCHEFLENLLKVSSKEPKHVEQKVRTWIQELIDMKLEPEGFCDRIGKLSNVPQQKYLVVFLKESLPLLRRSLGARELVLKGIRSPNVSLNDSKTPKRLRLKDLVTAVQNKMMTRQNTVNTVPKGVQQDQKGPIDPPVVNNSSRLDFSIFAARKSYIDPKKAALQQRSEISTVTPTNPSPLQNPSTSDFSTMAIRKSYVDPKTSALQQRSQTMAQRKSYVDPKKLALQQRTHISTTTPSNSLPPNNSSNPNILSSPLTLIKSYIDPKKSALQQRLQISTPTNLSPLQNPSTSDFSTLAQRKSYVDPKKLALQQRSQTMAQRKSYVDPKKSVLQQRSQTIVQRKSYVDLKESALQQRTQISTTTPSNSLPPNNSSSPNILSSPLTLIKSYIDPKKSALQQITQISVASSIRNPSPLNNSLSPDIFSSPLAVRKCYIDPKSAALQQRTQMSTATPTNSSSSNILSRPDFSSTLAIRKSYIDPKSAALQQRTQMSTAMPANPSPVNNSSSSDTVSSTLAVRKSYIDPKKAALQQRTNFR